MADSVPPIFLATAIEAVIHAGDVQIAHLGHDIHVDKKGAIDLVTEIDVQIERYFRALIAERFPDHLVLGEEFGHGDGAADAGRPCWVFDPLDGTTNYAHGLPIFCSSLALELDEQPVVAAVYDPTRLELFTAERGKGAWLNGLPMHVSHAETLIDSLLCTGFHYGIHNDVERAELIDLFSEFTGLARAVRRLGSAAIDMCYVAAGRLDGFWEKKLQPWDIAAAGLIVAEAGGQVSTQDGLPFRSRAGSVLASNGRIHQAMLETIRRVSGRFRSRNWTE